MSSEQARMEIQRLTCTVPGLLERSYPREVLMA